MSPQPAETTVRDELISPEVLEFRGIGTSVSGKVDKFLRPFQVAVMIGRDIGDKVGGAIITHYAIANLELIHLCGPPMSKVLRKAG